MSVLGIASYMYADSTSMQNLTTEHRILESKYKDAHEKNWRQVP